MIQHLPALIIATPLLAAFITPLIKNKKARNIFVLIVMAITFILTIILVKEVFENGILIYTMGAKEPTEALPKQAAIPIRIVLEIDGISAFMALISVFISLIGIIYSFVHVQERGRRFYTLFLLMVVGMLGMELTGDLFNLFVFLEIASIASAALIAYEFRRGSTTEAAFKYIVISSLAALFVLFAIGLLYGEYDLLNMAAIANAIKTTGLSNIDKIALILFFSAFAMKAGSAPMHMWMPDAYGEAPGAISMVLIAVTQASLYALLRICFTIYVDSLHIIIPSIIIILGLISIFIGVTMALIQEDIKRLIAYAAVAEIGYILLGMGVGLYGILSNEIETFARKALQGGLFHLFNDIIDIGLLFLIAGGIIYVTKERNLNKLGGLAHSMKYTSILFIIGLAAVAGLPPMNGFASKIIIYESVYKVSPILSIVAILASIVMLAIFVKIFHAVFAGPKIMECKEVPKIMLFSMLILASLIIFFGLFPDLIIKNIVDPAVNALIENSSYIAKIMGG